MLKNYPFHVPKSILKWMHSDTGAKLGFVANNGVYFDLVN